MYILQKWDRKALLHTVNEGFTIIGKRSNMENLYSMTVKNLQAKCREVGVSCSGNKKQLIERLENLAEKQNEPMMTERINQCGSNRHRRHHRYKHLIRCVIPT